MGLAVGLAALSTPARADIYRFIDRNGVMHFTNAPTSGKYKFYLREPRPIRPRTTEPL